MQIIYEVDDNLGFASLFREGVTETGVVLATTATVVWISSVLTGSR